MAELVPAPFADLVTRLHLEPSRQDALFELPRRKWFFPDPDGPDLTVHLHDQPAGNASGPAAGPHTQMAQNILLSYVAGGRILELKTVQVDDRLTIPRPCIDMTNVGYNVEWSQELLVPDSVREYVAGMMLVEIFRRTPALSGGRLDGPPGDVIYDLSVGYDLQGIRGDKVRGFLDAMRDASAVVARLRDQIPRSYASARDLPFPTQLSRTLTLSTFHGCPADEIERITEFLIAEHDLDVIIKMNPPTLGRERLEHLLHDVLGYAELHVNPTAYSSVVSFPDSVALCERLTSFAGRRRRRVGFKFSNTLEVLNHRPFFTPDNKVMYLSGQPLHVITLTLADEFRRAVGPDVPISFSAGIDRQNFSAAVACGFVPVTVSSDLLRPGGYGRLPGYLHELAAEMRKAGAVAIDDFILKRYGHEADALRRAPGDRAAALRRAGLLNTAVVAELARNDPRYRADRNRAVPRRIDSHLVTFDCLTCDKCLPVCPNAANFTYPTPRVAFDYRDLLVAPDGRWRQAAEPRRFEIDEAVQIANYADFCNECGNCDTFCPEYGGPYIKKPGFYGSVESWRRAAPRDGFVVAPTAIRARIRGVEMEMRFDRAAGRTSLDDGTVNATFASADHAPVDVRPTRPLAAEHRLDMWAYHTLRHLHAGVLDPSRLNQINVAAAAPA